MAFPSITVSNAYHRPAAFRAVYAKAPAKVFQTLGSISGGELKFTNFAEADSQGRNKAHAIGFTAKCKMKQASLIELELLDTLQNGTNDFLFQLSDAAAVPDTAAATEGWVGLTSAQVNVKAKPILDGTPENNRVIELEWSGSLLLSELDAAVKYSLEKSYFDDGSVGDPFFAIGTYDMTTHNGGLPTNSHIVPNGVSKIEIAATGGAYVELGRVKNFKGSFDFLSDPDGLKRHSVYAVAVDLEYEWMQTDAADLLNLDAMDVLDVDVKVTMLSGLIITLSNQVGITTDYEVSGDFDKIKVVRFKHTGKILTTSFDGIVSGA